MEGGDFQYFGEIGSPLTDSQGMNFWSSTNTDIMSQGHQWMGMGHPNGAPELPSAQFGGSNTYDPWMYTGLATWANKPSSTHSDHGYATTINDAESASLFGISTSDGTANWSNSFWGTQSQYPSTFKFFCPDFCTPQQVPQSWVKGPAPYRQDHFLPSLSDHIEWVGYNGYFLHLNDEKNYIVQP